MNALRTLAVLIDSQMDQARPYLYMILMAVCIGYIMLDAIKFVMARKMNRDEIIDSIKDRSKMGVGVFFVVSLLFELFNLFASTFGENIAGQPGAFLIDTFTKFI